jgi:hypothetical protein
MVTRSRYTFGGKLGNAYPIDDQLRAMVGRDMRFASEAARLPLLLVSERFDFTLLYPVEILTALQGFGGRAASRCDGDLSGHAARRGTVPVVQQGHGT